MWTQLDNLDNGVCVDKKTTTHISGKEFFIKQWKREMFESKTCQM